MLSKNNIAKFSSAILASEWSRYFRLVKEIGWLTIGQIITMLGALGIVRVLAIYLEPDQYGQLSLAMTVAGLINQVITGGIQNAVQRFYSIALERQDINGYLHAAAQLMLYATIVTIVASSFFIAAFLYLGHSQWVVLVLAILTFALLNSYKSAIAGIQNASRQRATVTLLNALENVSRIILIFCLVLRNNASILQIILAYILSSLLVIIFQYLYLQRIFVQPTIKRSHPWIREMWSFAWPFATWGIATWIQQSAPRFALETFATTADVGFFSILSQLGYAPVQMVITFTLSFLMPVIFSRVGDAGCANRVNKSLILTKNLAFLGLILTVIAFFLMLFYHSMVFQLFTTDKYSPVSRYLPWFVLAGGLFGVAQIYATQLMALKITHTMISAVIGSAIVGTFTAYLGVWLFSLPGAVGALLIHAITYLVWMVLSVHAVKNHSTMVS